MQPTETQTKDPMREFDGMFREDKDSVVIRIPVHAKRAANIAPQTPCKIVFAQDNRSLTVRW